MAPRKKSKESPAPAGPGGVLLTLQPGMVPDTDPDTEPELSPEQAAELTTVEDRFAGLPGETPVEIYRYQEDGDLGFCGKMPSHVFSPSEVARRWRTAGKYRAMARIKDKKGQVIPGGIRAKVFTLDAISIAEYAGSAPPVGVAAAPAGDGLQLANGMAALLSTVTAAMGSMITAMNTRPQGESSLDQLDKLAGVLKTLMPDKAAGPDQELASRMVGMVNDVLDIKDRIGGGGKDEDPLMSIARDNLPRFLAVLEAAAKRGADPNATRMLAELRAKETAAKQLPAPVTAPTAGPVSTEAPVWQLALNARKGHLLAMAQRNKDAAVNADYEFMLMEGTAVAGPFRAFLAAPDAVQQILVAAPEFQAYEEWATVFVVRLQELFDLVPEGSVDALYIEDDGPNHNHEPGAPCPATCPAFVGGPTEEGSAEAGA